MRWTRLRKVDDAWLSSYFRSEDIINENLILHEQPDVYAAFESEKTVAIVAFLKKVSCLHVRMYQGDLKKLDSLEEMCNRVLGNNSIQYTSIEMYQHQRPLFKEVGLEPVFFDPNYQSVWSRDEFRDITFGVCAREGRVTLETAVRILNAWQAFQREWLREYDLFV